jgi:hypothetical protein
MTVTQMKERLANKSGIYPAGNKILVKPDEIEEVSSGEHGAPILLPEKVRERHEASACCIGMLWICRCCWP